MNTVNPTNLLGICCILDSANKSIRVNNTVAARNLLPISLFLPVLVVGKFVILHIKCELVVWIGLQQTSK
jgi:hypothetical protein